MDKIFFDFSTYIFKTKMGLKEHQNEIIGNTFNLIKTFEGGSKYGNYAYKNNENFVIENKLDLALKLSLERCEEIYKSEKKIIPKEVVFESWINVTESKGYITEHFKKNNEPRYHSHFEINKNKIANNIKSFIPNYIFVYYIQMPNILKDDDGVLYILGKDQKNYSIRPEEDDLFIMQSDIPHAPNNAPNATKDRFVLAGNVKFVNDKKINTLI